MQLATHPADHAAARPIEALFERYGESHRNRLNKSIHWVCVPTITWTVLALLWALHPLAAGAFVLFSLGYYLRLSPPLAGGMLLVSGMLLGLCTVVPNLAMVAGAVFLLAWIGQFAGHLVEGKRPSFFEDLHFLLIGPLWLMSFVYRRLGVRY